MTPQVLFFDVFFEIDPHLNAVMSTQTRELKPNQTLFDSTYSNLTSFFDQKY